MENTGMEITGFDLTNWQIESVYNHFGIEQMRKRNLKPNEYLIYTVLIRITYGYGDYETSASLDRLQDLTGVDKRTISKALKVLVEKDFIRKIKSYEAGPKKATVYRITMQKGMDVKFRDKKDTNETKNDKAVKVTKDLIEKICMVGIEYIEAAKKMNTATEIYKTLITEDLITNEGSDIIKFTPKGNAIFNANKDKYLNKEETTLAKGW